MRSAEVALRHLGSSWNDHRPHVPLPARAGTTDLSKRVASRLILRKHPVITQNSLQNISIPPTICFMDKLGRNNKAERGSAERRKLLFLCVGLYAPPLLMVCGALDPRLNKGSMSPGRPFTSLRGADESLGLWERATLISFPSRPPHLLLVALSEAQHARGSPTHTHATNTPSHWTPEHLRRSFSLTSVSSPPFSSRVQKVLGPLPSTRVCLQCILFSESQVGRLCRQKKTKRTSPDPSLTGPLTASVSDLATPGGEIQIMSAAGSLLFILGLIAKSCSQGPNSGRHPPSHPFKPLNRWLL